MFPSELRDPKPEILDGDESTPPFEMKLIMPCSALLIVVYDCNGLFPVSNDMSLGCVMENIWLMATSLGIGVQVLSLPITAGSIQKKIKKLLAIPVNLQIAFGICLGYSTKKHQYLRVRRDIEDFTHHNCFGNRGISQ